MKRTLTPLDLRSAPEPRFAVVPTSPVPFRGTQDTEFERLKGRLLGRLLNEAEAAALYAPLRRAANDAAAMAWASGYPLLFLPALLEEKALSAHRQAAHQKRVLRRCQPSRSMAA